MNYRDVRCVTKRRAPGGDEGLCICQDRHVAHLSRREGGSSGVAHLSRREGWRGGVHKRGPYQRRAAQPCMRIHGAAEDLYPGSVSISSYSWLCIYIILLMLMLGKGSAAWIPGCLRGWLLSGWLHMALCEGACFV